MIIQKNLSIQLTKLKQLKKVDRTMPKKIREEGS